jgi:hypothetical protein
MNAACAVLCVLAAYLQHEMIAARALEGESAEEFEKDMD